MRQARVFTPQSMYEDWTYTWTVTDIAAWDEPDDEVVLRVSPEHVEWDDYGLHSRTFPTSSGVTPWWSASSADDGDYVVLTNPNVVSLLVPYTTLQQLGPGVVNIGLMYHRTDTDRRRRFWYGRLPLMDTGGV